MLKSYSELSKIDVTPYCDYRDAKDDQGRKIKVPFLNWAVCKKLLHENGAESVYYTPMISDNGSYLFVSREVTNKDGRETGCYFVRVEIHIDEKTYQMDMPLLNGTNVVYDDTLNQLRIANAHARAFVKGVAIHTGLGFDLWAKEKDTDTDQDDLSGHNVLMVKKRIEQKLTEKMQKGFSMDEILSAAGATKKSFNTMMLSLELAYTFEKSL